MTPEEAIRDPFVLEFLDIRDEYSDSDLEAALIRHLADFLLELGDDFAFVGRQRRLRIDDSWFRVDLVFAGARPQAESPPIQGLANGRVDGLYCHGPGR